MSKKKGVNIDIQQAIAWCKSNIVLVILVIASISAIVGLPRVATTWKSEVENALQDRSSTFLKLDKLFRTRVVDPSTGETASVVVNEQLNIAIKGSNDALKGDSDADFEHALQLNRKNYGVLYADSLFNNPDISQLETLPELFHRELALKYKSLLELANAGSAATSEELATYLEDARVRFMETNLSTRQDADLTKEQRKNLETHLAELRIGKLRSHAEDISVYFDEATLNIPQFSLAVIPGPGELFIWQWRYWAVADIIRVIATINDGQSEITSLIKRVVSIEIVGLPVPDESSSDGGSRPPGGSNPPRPGGGPPQPSGPGGGLNPTGNPSGPSGSPPRPNPSPSGGRPPRGGGDMSGLSPTHTGQKSGDLYDILQVHLTVIVDTKRIPQILDSLATHNFLTVIDLKLRPADKYVAMGAGYDYGVASVSEMTLVLEAAWLRAWTVKSMPDSVKNSLGIKTDG
jgi:hypothetical protein